MLRFEGRRLDEEMRGEEAAEEEEQGGDGDDERDTGVSTGEQRSGWRAAAMEMAATAARSVAASVAGMWGRMRGKRHRGDGEREEEERKRRRTGDG